MWAAWILAAAIGPARGAGMDVDVELQRPTFADGAVLSADSPRIDVERRVRGGVALQLEREPLVLYDAGGFKEVVVGWRYLAHVGVDAAVARWLAFRASVPMALQNSSRADPWTADQVALGDASLGGRMRAWTFGGWEGGVHFDVALPTAATQSWMGDGVARPGLGVAQALRLGAIDAGLDAAATYRERRETELDFNAGSTLALRGSLRYWLPGDHVATWVACVGRVGFDDVDPGRDGASEILAALDLHRLGPVDLALGGGYGLGGGPGAPTWRAFLQVVTTTQPRPREFEPPPSRTALAITAVPEDLDELEEAEPPPPPRDVPAPLATVTEDEIAIRDPIRFEFGTAKIVPESRPTLAAIAALLTEDGGIGHVVIVGHASEEGSFAYNYDLSGRRARSTWEALVAAGVAPERMSFSGMGEVQPTGHGVGETALAENRRVVFRIVQRVAPGPGAAADRQVTLPWDGTSATVHDPAPPPPPASPAPPAPPSDRPPPSEFEEDE